MRPPCQATVVLIGTIAREQDGDHDRNGGSSSSSRRSIVPGAGPGTLAGTPASGPLSPHTGSNTCSIMGCGVTLVS